MIHYSCDRCKRILDPAEDLRYAVTIEVQAMMDPLDIDEDEDDRDHLLEIQEILERINKLGIGPQGLGGRTTALAVHILHKACHIASMPVAVNIECHAHRHNSVVIT